jgi:tRNA pseudouridine55 synthase
MNGVLVVDKPVGPTSHDVVARVRRAIGIPRIGHTGTLDPLASGVLPLVVGRATRLAQFLTAGDKEYVAVVHLGAESDTYDAQGRMAPGAVPAGAALARYPAGRPGAGLDALLDEFRGTYWQTPPPFSAKKVGGTPAYELARRNQPVDLKPVSVTVTALEAVESDADRIRLRVVCSAGFYVRTLAHELGQRLGCGGYLEALRRIRAGEFSVEGAVPLDALEAEGMDAVRHLLPLDGLLAAFPGVVLTERGARRAAHGNALSTEDVVAPCAAERGTRVRMIDGQGALLGIAEPAGGGVLHPVVVLV